MKCYTVDGSGLDSLRLQERPGPGDPGPGDVLVAVRAVSLNYRDLMVADGRYSGKQDPPIIACSDMAGIVVKTGPGVREFHEGDRVLNAPFRFWPAGKLRSEWARTFGGGAGLDGVLAEQVVYPAAALVRLPEDYSLAQGATLPVAGLTAWAVVVTHGKIQPGEWVLTHGTGGVSVFAVQIARMFHAHVILTTANEAKANVIREKTGLDAVVDYREADWPARVREITGGRGADVVVEVAGGETLAKSIQACANGARVGLVGVLSGTESHFNVLHMVMRQVTVRGILMESTEELRALVRALEAARVFPYVDRIFPFDQAHDAYEYLKAQKHVGKVIVEVESGK